MQFEATVNVKYKDSNPDRNRLKLCQNFRGGFLTTPLFPSYLEFTCSPLNGKLIYSEMLIELST